MSGLKEAVARALLEQALRELDHCEGKTKQARRSIETVRGLVDRANRELSDEPRPPARGELPPGTVEGRSNIRQGDWVK